MKVSRVGFVVVLLSISLLLINNNSSPNTSAKTTSNLQNKLATPSFLEKGKTYYFRFAFGTGEGNVITGKVMNLDVETGWVLINHYVLDRSRYKYDGYSWINLNQVYQCSEMAT